MNGPFCFTKVTNNEDYKRVVKRRMSIMILLFLLGALTFSIAFFAKNLWTVTIKEYMLGVYSGVGVGLMFASAALWIKNKLLLADEEKLKKSRINNTDERIQEISNRAFKIASITLLIALYVVGLIGGLFNPVLVKVLLSMLSTFLLVYLISYKVYEKRM